tara:strand:- start:995 stop:1174 length:180 start_codon:yes stop_codon:yes gene_type:complete
MNRQKDLQEFVRSGKIESLTLTEDTTTFFREFRRLYVSGKRYSFREWMEEFAELIDHLS